MCLKHKLEILLAKSLADVVVGTHDSIVSTSAHGSLEEIVNHPLSSGDILLVIGKVIGKTLPFVLLGLLFLVNFLFLRFNLEARG